jgi:hypothetical protein
MSGPAAGRTHLVLVATGMVGGYALRYALEHPAVERVTVIGRRTLGISHTKLNEILHPNFSDCSALAESLLLRMQRSFAWAPIPAQCRTLSSIQ